MERISPKQFLTVLKAHFDIQILETVGPNTENVRANFKQKHQCGQLCRRQNLEKEHWWQHCIMYGENANQTKADIFADKKIVKHIIVKS